MSLVTSKNFIVGLIVGLILPWVVRYVMGMLRGSASA